MGSGMCVAVVIPTYNERENVVELLSRLESVLGEMGVCRRYIVVDDNSPDGTAEAVRGLREKMPWIRVVVRPGKLGIGSAILRGIREALAMEEVTHIVTMDADLSHRPEDLPALLEKAGEADLVQGSRYMPGGGVENWGLHRKLISWGRTGSWRGCTMSV